MLHIAGCPNASALVNRLTDVLAGTTTRVATRTIKNVTEAAELGMHGSPTVLVDGRDPFASTPEASIACRLYATEEGLRGLPTVQQLQSALRTARAASS